VQRAATAPPRAAERPRSPWAVTVVATVASTYALDAFATAVGAALEASGRLAPLDRTALLGILAVTYLLWAAGLATNLAANWRLLAATGTSTNVLSKLAHDLAVARGGPSRFAASAGYVLTELLKEVPYYAGAFGASVATDAVTTSDALIFLAGTNIGAAVYEYGLARATRWFLRRRPDGPPEFIRVR
jgi:hypothetical protein